MTAAATASRNPMDTVQFDDGACFHCGTEINAGQTYAVSIHGVSRVMCCPGCQAVAQAIVDAGHSAYYRNRTALAQRQEALPEEFAALFKRASMREAYVRERADGVAESDLLIEGITCAACVWLLERQVGAQPGVTDVSVNFATHRLQVRWDAQRSELSRIVQAIRDVGYVPHPYSVDNEHALAVAERRRQLRRLGIAGLLGMQIMTLSVALYAGDWYGIEAEFRTFFRWVSLVLATPIVLYAARPFFVAAWRDVTRGAPGMDVPVALGIALAFLASVRATFTDNGEVYFDSVAMFTFLLLGARYLEFSVRRSALDAVDRLVAATPQTALRLHDDGRLERIPTLELIAGDKALVRPGDPVPADGVVIDGHSTVDESLLTGESQPVEKRAGDALVTGSTNMSGPLTMRVQQCGERTQLSAIVALTDRAQQEKPRSVRAADQIAVWFVGTVLVLTALVGSYWYARGEPAWLDIVLAMLVVSCPCALSLATPSAITAMLNRLLRMNVLVTRSAAMETLAKATHFVFDKTGTLTSTHPVLAAVHTLADRSAEDCRHIAAALECHSTHPLAVALRCGYETAAAATEVSTESGGLSGNVGDDRFWLGSESFVTRHTGIIVDSSATLDDAGSIVYLSDAQRVLAKFVFCDVLREHAADVIADLRQRDKQVWLLTGDHHAAAQRVAGQLGVDRVQWALTPRGKLENVRRLQAQGATVAMIGDGVNDAPVLAQSQVSIAMGGGAGLAAANADVVLLGDRLMDLRSAVTAARTTRRAVAQNLSWAVLYNLAAIPAAALGYVPPWLAALGMSLSSLLVVGNAYRLQFARL